MSLPRRYISVSEAASYIGIAVKTCYELCLRGEIPSVKIGRSRRVDLKSLEAKLQTQIDEMK